MPIPSTSSDPTLEPWQPEGVTIHEGDPQGRGFTLTEVEEDGHMVGVYIFECEPSRTTYYLENNEIVHVLEGEVEIRLDDGDKVEMGPGDTCFLAKGQNSHWWFKTRFKEVAVLAT